MTLDELIKKYTGQPIDFDGIYPNQCMDLMHQYIYDVLGINDKTVCATPSAYQVYTTFKWGQYFTKIANSLTGVPQKGDIVVFDTSIGAWGHVCIFVSGDVNSFKSFDANWPTGSLPHIQDHNYNGVLGWLRPLETLSGATITIPIVTNEMLVKKATERDNIADFYKFDKSGNIDTKVIEKITELDKKKAEIQNALDTCRTSLNTQTSLGTTDSSTPTTVVSDNSDFTNSSSGGTDIPVGDNFAPSNISTTCSSVVSKPSQTMAKISSFFKTLYDNLLRWFR